MLAKKIVAWMLLRVVNTMTVGGTSKKTLPPQSLADFERGSGGLLFKDQVVGSGRSPDEGDEIEVHYKGWFFAPQSSEGIQFDDSRAEDPTRGLIFEFGKANNRNAGYIISENYYTIASSGVRQAKSLCRGTSFHSRKLGTCL